MTVTSRPEIPEIFTSLCEQEAAIGHILVFPKLPECFEENTIFIDGRKNKKAFEQANNFLQEGYRRINFPDAKPNKKLKAEESNYGVLIAEVEAEHLKEVTGMDNPSVLKNVIIDLNAEEFCVYSEITISSGYHDANQKLFQDHSDRLETLGRFFGKDGFNQKVTVKLDVKMKLKSATNLKQKFFELFETKCKRYGMKLVANENDAAGTGTNVVEGHGMHTEFKRCVSKLVQLCKPFEEEFKMQEIKLEPIQGEDSVGDESERLIKLVDKQLSSMSGGTCFLREVQDIFQEAALLDATKSGLMDENKELTKIPGEVEKFEELIKTTNRCGAGIRGIFVRNTNQTKLQHFVKASQSLRFEFDWIFVSHDFLLFIDITSGRKGEVDKKLDQLKSQYIRTREMFRAIVTQWKRTNEIDDQDWMAELDKKYAKNLIITPKISNSDWNEKLKNENIIEKLKNVNSLEFLFVASEEVCDNIGKKELMTFTKGTKNGVFELKESQLTLRQLLTPKRDDSKYKRLVKYIGSIILASHVAHFHRGPNDEFSYLVPGRFREPSKQQVEIDKEITQYCKEGTGSRLILLGESGSGKTFFCLYMADKCIQELNFGKVFYALPESKKHLREMVEKLLREEYKYAKDDKRIVVCSMEETKTFFPDETDMDSNYALIVDECLASSKENLIEFLEPVSGLFPYCQFVLVSLSVLGQMCCSTEEFDHSVLQGFQRRVLTVGYRSTRKIATFNSTLLHSYTRKHMCGTSTCVVAPAYKQDEQLELEVIQNDITDIREQVETWRENCRKKNHLAGTSKGTGIFIFQDDEIVSLDLNFKDKADVFELITWENELTTLNSSGCEIRNVLILLLTKKEFLDNSHETCLFLAATTRARMSLRILVSNSNMERFLKAQRDKTNLLLEMKDALVDKNVHDKPTILRNISILSLQERFAELKKTLFSEKQRNCPELKETIPNTFRTLLTKRKGENFLRKVAELFQERKVGHYLTIQQLFEWLRTGFERGYIEAIEIFSEFLEQEVKKNLDTLSREGREEEKTELLEDEKNVLYWACYNGNPKVVQYALKEVLEPILGMEKVNIKAVITQQIYLTNCRDDSKQPLLGIIARQNRSPQVFRMLLDELEIQSGTIDKQTSIAIREAFQWTIKYCSIRFLKGILQPGYEFLIDLFKKAFQENDDKRKATFLTSLQKAGERFDVVTADYLNS